MMLKGADLSELLCAYHLDRVGVVRYPSQVDESAMQEFDRWVARGLHADMTYLERNRNLRQNPFDLLPGAKSMLICAVSYFPERLQRPDAPRVAKYAYGRDYHKSLKKLLTQVAVAMGDKALASNPSHEPHDFRVFVDSAPLMERYWALRSGLGFIGRNQNLIVPRVGSFLFIGEILTTLELEPFDPQPRKMVGCGTCRRCIDACPTAALSDQGLDANRCLSYLTIEHRGPLPHWVISHLDNRFFGCDTCQDVCPYNRRPVITTHFPSFPQIVDLSFDDLTPFTVETYEKLFFGTALTRAKYEGLQRNLEALS